jgi:siderophore synthetase component
MDDDRVVMNEDIHRRILGAGYRTGDRLARPQEPEAANPEDWNAWWNANAEVYWRDFLSEIIAETFAHEARERAREIADLATRVAELEQRLGVHARGLASPGDHRISEPIITNSDGTTSRLKVRVHAGGRQL